VDERAADRHGRGPRRLAQAAQHQRRQSERGGVDGERRTEPDLNGDHRRDRRDNDLRGHRRGPDAAVGRDKLIVLDGGRQQGLRSRAEEDLSRR